MNPGHDSSGKFVKRKPPSPEMERDDTVHATHAQDPVHPEVHDEAWDRPWQPPSNLDAPEARPGMSQRWVRTHLGGKEDTANVESKFREGWRPRRADTAPQVHTSKISGGRFDGVIGIHGMILCEMPTERLQQREAHYRKDADRQMEAVQSDLAAQNHPVLGPINQTRRTEVTRGRRRPPVPNQSAEAGE